MITTKNIKVDLSKQAGRLKQVTTKTIDASIPTVKNPNPVKAKTVSTGTIEDVADIAEKKRRDEIMVEKNQQKIEVFYSPIVSFGSVEDDKGFNLQYAVVEIDGLLQGISRRELK